nr:hypothetical protein [Tanacetum cinerariifolium]
MYFKKQDKMYYPRFTKAIIYHFLTKDKPISMRNRTFMHTARNDSLLGTMRFVSKHEDTQVYGALLPKAITNQAILESDSYKTYYEIATGAKPLKPKKTQKKSDSVISSKETPFKKNLGKAKKDLPSTKKPATKPKPTKNKAPVKADRGKGDVTNFESWVPDEQQCKISGDSGEDDDDDDSEDESDDDKGNDDDGDNDNNDDDSDHERTRSDINENPNLNQSNEEHEEEKEEYVDDIFHTPKNYKLTDEEDYAINAKEENEEEKDNAEELYKDVNMNLRKEDVEMTDADQGGADRHNISQESGFEQVEKDAHVTLITVHDTQKTKGPMLSSSVSYDFTDKLLNFKNASLADNEIASLMDTTIHHEETSSHTSFFFTVPVTIILEIMYAFTTTNPPPPHSFNSFLQQATPTPKPTDLEVTTLFLALPDFSSVFKFNDRFTKMEKYQSEMKQVDQYTQAISLIPAIVDYYIGNKLREAIQKAIKSHTAECKEEALADKREYIDLIDTSVRAIMKEQVKTQLP